MDFYELDPTHTDPARIRREREKAQKLKKTQWWLNALNRGICHYCSEKVTSQMLTMDHVVPLARGGTSVPGNIVPACRKCNQQKKLELPVERLFKEMELARAQVHTDIHE